MKIVVPFSESPEGKKAQVETMFDSISGKYDLMNRLITFGIDKSWRQKAIKLLKKDSPKIILDVATGTADFAIAALELKPEKIIGVDISNNMLHVGREKILNKGAQGIIELIQADSENLPYPDNFFDAATVGYGVRNFEDLMRGLQEIHRVLKPKGRLVILETSQPKANFARFVVQLHAKFVVKTLGKLISRNDKAYEYLPESAKHFPCGDDFVEILNKCGFKETTCTPLFLSVSSIYQAKK